MYFRYTSPGDNAKEALLYCRINKLGHTHKIDKHNITSRTDVCFVENIDGLSASKMEQLLLFAYAHDNIKDKQERIVTETEYNSHKKLIIYFGKTKYNIIMKNMKSKNSCIGLKENNRLYRFVYYS